MEAIGGLWVMIGLIILGRCIVEAARVVADMFTEKQRSR